jgi:NTE family protein
MRHCSPALFWALVAPDNQIPEDRMNRGPKKTIKLALQGGGSHGAFTWGVLDQLLDDERLRIEAVSGTSAGAMNAVALADGMAAGGPAEARKRLENFWSATSRPLQLI